MFDRLAFVASGTLIHSIDLLTGEFEQSLDLGGAELTDIAREGAVAYTMDAQRTLRAIDLSGFDMEPRGSLTLPDGGGRLFVGNGIAYAVANSNFRGGFATADVSDPDNITLISGSDVPSTEAAPKTDFVANGSGLGLAAGTPSNTEIHLLNIMDVSDPAETNVFVTRFDLPVSPSAVALASGIAYLADGTAGLQVINYLPFDNQGQPPGGHDQQPRGRRGYRHPWGPGDRGVFHPGVRRRLRRRPGQ